MKIDKEALYASSVGIEIALSIGLGMFFGWWLDKKFDTAPWLFIIFLMAGIGSSIKAVIRIMKIVENQDNEINYLNNDNNLDKEKFNDHDNIPE